MVVGSARDIIEEVGVPRFVFADFPLGNPMGKPDDAEMQSATLGLALDLIESAIASRTTVQTPFVWSADDDGWRERFMAIEDPDALAAAGAERRARQAAEKAAGLTR